MQSTTMTQPKPRLEFEQLQKGLTQVGLNLSESELDVLNIGNTIFLEEMGLSEIGSVFILASAMSPINLGQPRKRIRFHDLPKVTQASAGCSGIPIYCWSSEEGKKRCLYLTMIDGKPAVRTSCLV